MRVPVNWLKELVDTEKTPQELADLFVSRGLGVENILRVGERLENTLVGEIINTDPKEIAVSVGKDSYKLLISNFQFPNLKLGDKVVFDAKTKQVLTKGEIEFEGSEIVFLPKEAITGEKVLSYLDDYVLDFEIAPNRGDLMGVIGIARELACYEEKELNLPKIKLTEDPTPIADKVSLEVIDKQGCPDYIARLILDVKIAPSPFWLQWRIHACGLRPVSNVVDISNYILFKYGQPLHTFDYDKLTGKKVIVRRAQKGEKIRTIDGVDRNLNDSVLMIADASRSVAIAGIMGGFDSEISIATKNVLLECARFNPVIIRKGTQFLKLTTEASKRFEMGIDTDSLENASKEATTMIADLAQGKDCQGKAEFRTPVTQKTAELSPIRVNKLLGIKLNKRKTKQILVSLGFQVKEKESLWQVQIPSFRTDVQRDADLIEEIGRVYGYVDIPSRFLLQGKEPGRRNQVSQKLNEIRNSLSGYGFNEIYTISFTDEPTAQLFYPEAKAKIPNPLNERYAVLRPMLLSTMLEVVNLNLRKGNKDLRLFEIGKIYFDDQGPKETTCLSAVMTGAKFPINWATKPESIDYYDLKAVLDILGKEWQLPDISYIPKLRKFLKAQDSTAIKVGDNEIGFIGSLTKEISDRYELGQEVYIFEIYLEKVWQSIAQCKCFKPLPRFPGVVRDFAFVLDKQISAAEVKKRVWQYGGELLESVETFDCFSGGPLAPDKKNLGIRLLLRSPDRTFLDVEANRIFDEILAGLKQNLNANLRGEKDG
jgi:phenylalanyl-tRNA synthetase beta chain